MAPPQPRFDRGSPDDDRGIIEGCREGREDAAVLLMARFSGDLLHYLRFRRIPTADHADICQEVHYAAVTQLQAGYFHGHAALRTWLRRIAAGKIADYRRAQSRHRAKDHAVARPADAHSHEWTDQELAVLLKEVLSTLPPRQAFVFRIYFLDRLTIADVAKRLSCSTSRAHEVIAETRKVVVIALGMRRNPKGSCKISVDDSR